MFIIQYIQLNLHCVTFLSWAAYRQNYKATPEPTPRAKRLKTRTLWDEGLRHRPSCPITTATALSDSLRSEDAELWINSGNKGSSKAPCRCDSCSAFWETQESKRNMALEESKRVRVFQGEPRGRCATDLYFVAVSASGQNLDEMQRTKRKRDIEEKLAWAWGKHFNATLICIEDLFTETNFLLLFVLSLILPLLKLKQCQELQEDQYGFKESPVSVKARRLWPQGRATLD